MAISPELILAQTAHDVAVNRFATTLSKRAIPFLKQSNDFVVGLLAKNWSTTTSKRKRDSIISIINSQLSDIYSEMDSILYDQFNEFALAEMDFTVKSIQEVLQPDLIMLPVEDQKLLAAISSEPLAISEQAIDYDAYVASIGKTSIERVNNFIGFGYAQGLTLQQMVNGIQGTKKLGYKDGLFEKDKINAERVVRTSVNHISNQAKLALYKQNSEIVEGYRIIATLDTRTSTICKGLDQTVVMPDDEYKPYPPFHPNCVLSGTIVTTCSDVNKLFKRAYKGLVIDIVTKSGRELSITPNHPVLTRGGWKDAKLINSSDQLATIPEDVFIGKDYKNSVKAEVSDLFSASYVSAEPSFIANRPTTAEHFHGDGTNGEVSVIDVDSLTWDRVKSVLDKKVINRKFSVRGAVNSALNSASSFYKRLSTALTSSTGVIGRFRVGASFLKGHSTHSSGLLSGSIPESSKPLFENSFNGAFRAIKAEVICNPSNANSRFISFDDVVDVTIREADSSCHVYNLENKDNWYLSNGIITHNCRTQVIAEIKDKALKDSSATRAANFKKQGEAKKGTVGQVSAQTQYYELLKRQSAAQQDLALGKVRGKIFRNAGLTVDEFKKSMTNRLGQPLTLAEMARKDKRILEYMKGNDFYNYLD